MIKLPEVNGTNWKKVLRELDIKTYPSLTDYLTNLRAKLLNKEELMVSENLIGKAKLQKYFEDYGAQINSLYIQTIDYSQFARQPMEHQKPAVTFLLTNNRCILGDDMGLGKSASCIYAALMMDRKYKVLVVTLKTLKYNFAKEVEILGSNHYIVEKKWEPGDMKFTICHYDQLKKHGTDIIEGNYDIIIMDEAHKVRNPKAKRTQVIMDVMKQTKPVKVWLLTGTPVDNRPADYYNLLKMIKHPIAKNWVTYVSRYCAGYQDDWGRWNTGGASNLTELHRLTKDVFLRRLKTVIKGLPTKTRRPLFLKLENTKGYDKCIEDYRKGKYEKLIDEVDYRGTEENVNVEVMTALMLHRQFCALEKIKDGSLIELIENLIEEDDTNKIIVFTNFTAVIDAVQEHFGKEICSVLDGRTLNPKKRLEIVDEFNMNTKKKVFAINQAVGSTGLNIQSANKEIVNDLNWVPSVMLQCEDRAFRIGQKRDVEVLYPIYDKTVEEKLYLAVEKKMAVISTVVEGKEQQYFEDSIVFNKEEEIKKERASLIEEIMKQMGL